MNLPKLLSKKDIQTRWGITKQGLFNRLKTDLDFPKPIMMVSDNKVPLFLETDIIKYENLKPWIIDKASRTARQKLFLKKMADK